MIKDFFTAALPWIVIGLTVAIFAATAARNKSFTKGASTSYCSLMLLWYSLGIFEWLTSGDFSSGIVSMSIGSMFLCIGAAFANKENLNSATL